MKYVVANCIHSTLACNDHIIRHCCGCAARCGDQPRLPRPRPTPGSRAANPTESCRWRISCTRARRAAVASPTIF